VNPGVQDGSFQRTLQCDLAELMPSFDFAERFERATLRREKRYCQANSLLLLGYLRANAKGMCTVPNPAMVIFMKLLYPLNVLFKRDDQRFGQHCDAIL